MSKVVTPEQYKQGWLGFLQLPKPMKLIKQLPDGNYLVEDPNTNLTQQEAEGEFRK